MQNPKFHLARQFGPVDARRLSGFGSGPVHIGQVKGNAVDAMPSQAEFITTHCAAGRA